jgi:hypothetical protein
VVKNEMVDNIGEYSSALWSIFLESSKTRGTKFKKSSPSTGRGGP